MVLGSALFRLNINSKKCEFFFEYLKNSVSLSDKLKHTTQ